MAISSSEARYIVESCLADFRVDGRSRHEHRPYAVDNRSVRSEAGLPESDGLALARRAPALILSNGSSRVHLPGGSTDVLCSVKADLVRPSPGRPDEGVVELAVDLSLCGGGGTAAGASGGGSGGGGGGAPRRRRQRREEESQIASLLQRLVVPHAVDYRRLAVWPGKYVWRLAVDLVVLRCDGCVLDAASVAAREALRCTLLPKVQAVMEGADDDGGGGGAGRGGGGTGGSSKNDLVVDGNVQAAAPPAGAEGCPLVATVSVLTVPPSSVGGGAGSAKRHRSVTIVDARTEEEACASSRVCVSVDPGGAVCGVHTLGGGGRGLLEEEEEEGAGGGVGGGGSSLPVAALGEVVNAAAAACEGLYRRLDRGGKQSGADAAEDGCGYEYLLRDRFLIQ